MLKRWLGLPPTSTPDFLYLSRSSFGLGFKSVDVFFKQMQVARASLLKYSLDPRMVELYSALQARGEARDRWTAAACLEQAERDIDIDNMTRAARQRKGKQGVGYVLLRPIPAPGTHGARAAVGLRIAEDVDGLRRVHLHGLSMQGEMMRWDELMAQDVSWNRLIYGLSPSLLGFLLKSTLNILATPDNQKRWGYGTYACNLCGKMATTQRHMLSCCDTALKQGRYLYRHNQVLSVLYDAVRSAAKDVTPKRVRNADETAPLKFYRAGKAPRVQKPRKPVSIIETASDWQSICDLPTETYVFPFDVATPTTKRPDIVMWSVATKQLVMLELTCPDETRVVESATLKQERYRELVDECSKTMKTVCLTVEVGTRGYVAMQSMHALRRLGVWSTTLHNKMSDAALRASYVLYTQRKTVDWSWQPSVTGRVSGVTSQ
jgi:hypothetical protein